MKRPEGLGGEPPARPPASPRGGPPPGRAPRSDGAARPTRAARTPSAAPAPNPARPAREPAAAVPRIRPASADRAARADARAAARERRREERVEVRRFTRRSRTRRLIATGAAATTLALVGGVALVTLSPLMALDTIEVVGAVRLDAAAVGESLDDHLGTPLALLDDGGIRDDLAAFPLIRSYSTEVIPPHTLVVRIVERAPVGAIERGAVVDLVDAAGVVVESSPERPAGIPLIAAASADRDSLAFRSVSAVLSALPDALRGQVDVISASTRDDVTFTMTGAGHRVVWGSAERSDFKARVLEAAIAATSQGAAWEYDVSAPESLVVRQL